MELLVGWLGSLAVTQRTESKQYIKYILYKMYDKHALLYNLPKFVHCLIQSALDY